jgi:heme-degrading monooxygenase HmoA
VVKHIVAWRLKEEVLGNTKEQNAKLIKEKLENLVGKIPGLLKAEVGINFTQDDCASDVVLYSEFESKEALAAYQVHPIHKEAASFVLECRTERRVIDYEV